MSESNIIYTTDVRVGGNYISFYSLNKNLDRTTREAYTSLHTWLKSYTDLNGIIFNKRDTSKENNALVCTLTLTKDKKILLDGKDITNEKSFEIYSGQYITKFKNTNLFQRYYIDYNLSLNPRDKLNSGSEEKVNFINDTLGEDVTSFLKRIKPSASSTGYFTPLQNLCFMYRGTNLIFTPIEKTNILINFNKYRNNKYVKVSNSCFKWSLIENNQVEETKQNADKTVMLDFKLVFNIPILQDWLTLGVFKDFENISKTLGGDGEGMDLNIIIHPPITTSMQFESSPSIISPPSGKTSKTVDTVVLRVPSSYVYNSQKIIFIDFKFQDEIVTYNSLDHFEFFTLIDKDGVKGLTSSDFELNIFEPISTIESNAKNVRFTFKIPSEILSKIEEKRFYIIDVKLSDLTSERRN